MYNVHYRTSDSMSIMIPVMAIESSTQLPIAGIIIAPHILC